jgi:hypothetical protein
MALKKIKTTVGTVTEISKFLADMITRPMKRKNLEAIMAWQDAIEPTMNKKMEEYGLNKRMQEVFESMDKKYTDLNKLLLKKKPTKEDADKLTELTERKRNEAEAMQRVIMTAFNDEEVEVPSFRFEYDELQPAGINLILMKSNLVEFK